MSEGDYKIVKVMGKGSYGTAYLAHAREDPSQRVVIKKIALRDSRPKTTQAAKREALLLGAFEHPNIIRHISHFMSDKNLCIVTELAVNGDLHRMVKHRRSMKKYFREEKILDWFVQIGCALKHVHDRKILHRDIKTANIFLAVSPDGKEICKLGDFGVSKILGNTAAMAHSSVGSPYYMSPEICSHQEYNHKTDVWSLGCVLYELCTLRQAFEGKNFSALCVKILRGRYQALPAQFSNEIRSLQASLLTLNPDGRPDMNQLLSTPFVTKRVARLMHLDTAVIQSEFAHTVLHGVRAKLRDAKIVFEPSSQQEKPKRDAPRVPLQQGTEQYNRGGKPQDVAEKTCVQPATEREGAGFDKFKLHGQTLHLPGLTPRDSLYSRVEALRVYLDQELGADTFLQAYRIMSAISAEEEERVVEEQLLGLVGEHKKHCLHLITQLICCEDLADAAPASEEYSEDA